jgi:hypothetical protein
MNKTKSENKKTGSKPAKEKKVAEKVKTPLEKLSEKVNGSSQSDSFMDTDNEADALKKWEENL